MREFDQAHVDDVVVFSESFADHCEHLRRVVELSGSDGIVLVCVDTALRR